LDIPTIVDLPSPSSSRHGWPWTEVSREQFINSYVDALVNLSKELANIDFYFLPHENRGKASDLSVCNDIYNLLPTEIKNVSAVVDFRAPYEVFFGHDTVAFTT